MLLFFYEWIIIAQGACVHVRGEHRGPGLVCTQSHSQSTSVKWGGCKKAIFFSLCPAQGCGSHAAVHLM